MNLSPQALMERVNALRCGKRFARPVDQARKALELLQPPERISTVDCAERYRLMPGSENGAIVRYDRMRTPYNVGPMNSLDDARCHGIVMVKPSRSGGTAVAENYAFKLMKFGPMTHIAWVLNSDEAVTDYVRNVVKPMFDLNPDLQARVGSRRGEDTDGFKKVSGYPFEWLSAKDSTFRNRQPGFMELDETDGWAKKWASSPRTQVDGRQKLLGNRRKAAIMSHADLGYRAGVAASFEDTSRAIYVMQCPECDGYAAAYATKYWDDVPEFKLTWTRNEQLPVDERVKRAQDTAALACPNCGSALTDEQRREMIDAALTRNDQSFDGWMHRGQLLDQERGVVGEPAAHSWRGFWVHGTMLKTENIAKLARDYEQALIKFERTKDASELKEFMSKQLGEIFEGAATTGGVSARALKARSAEAGYDRGLVPPGVQFITAAVDPGRRTLDVLFTGWDLHGRSWLIDRQTLRQMFQDDGQWRDIDLYGRIGDWDLLWSGVLNRQFPMMADPDQMLPVAVTVLDASDGNVTWKAREFARRAARAGYAWQGFQRLQLIKGVAGKRPMISDSVPIDRDENGKPVQPVLREFRLGVDSLKAQALERLATTAGDPGCCYFPRDIEGHYLDQFFGETLVDGKWIRNGPNETLDLAGYAEAGRQMMSPDREQIDWINRRPIWATAVSLRPAQDAEKDKPGPDIFAAFSSINEE
jgi:phage terminase large subunit GpA-like protein